MKYYTPKIEEFHVGFEYEVKLNSGEWVKYTLTTLSELNFEDWSLKQNDVRVKHLDTEGLESLGWNVSNFTYTKINNDIEYYYEMILKFSDITHTFEIKCTQTDLKAIYLLPPTPFTIYLGESPSNKSELKNLMLKLRMI